jgi:hypothetical protein
MLTHLWMKLIEPIMQKAYAHKIKCAAFIWETRV